MFKYNFPALAKALNTIDPQAFPPYHTDFWRSVVGVSFGDVVDEYVVRYFEEKGITEEKRELLRDEVEKEVMEFLNSLPCYRVG